MEKRGISLIVLVITMVVMSILAFTIVLNVDDSTQSAKITTFAEELRNIDDSVQTYYLKNNEYPVVKGVSYTKEGLLSISSSSAELKNEFDLNNDNSQTYYKIDLKKLTKSDSLYGNDKFDKDFYVISEDGNFIYYPFGIDVGDTWYFSLTSKLGKISGGNTTLKPSGSIEGTSKTSGITVEKSTEEWTNNLNITIDSDLNEGEKIYYKLSNDEKAIDAVPFTLTFSSQTLSSTQKKALEDTGEVNFIKKSGDTIISSRTLKLNNLDVEAPVINKIEVITYSDYNVIKFTEATDNKSGIVASYYTTDTSDMTAEELINSGEKGDRYSIKLYDKTITSLQMVIVDRAGNISEVTKVSI